MTVVLYDSFVSEDREMLSLVAESTYHTYRVDIDRKDRSPRYYSDTQNSRLAVNLMVIANRLQDRMLEYLDTPPYTMTERARQRNELPERNAQYNALSDIVKQERV